MNVLITAGGTQEAIDSVRSIKNYSTGRLGSIIADKFAKKNATITYVCDDSAVLPSLKNVEIVHVRSVQNLLQTIDKLLIRHEYDCVIHSMAVSDFTPQAILTLDDIVTNLASLIGRQDIASDELSNIIRTALLASGKPIGGGKISSATSELIVLLSQTPKIINRIKAKQPEAVLIGFKLLSGVPEEKLLLAAKKLLEQSSCDFVLANDLQNIVGDLHKAVLVDKNGNLKRANTKQEIAEVIYTAISERTIKF